VVAKAVVEDGGRPACVRYDTPVPPGFGRLDRRVEERDRLGLVASQASKLEGDMSGSVPMAPTVNLF
jgi:hypothetical protein